MVQNMISTESFPSLDNLCIYPGKLLLFKFKAIGLDCESSFLNMSAMNTEYKQQRSLYDSHIFVDI